MQIAAERGLPALGVWLAFIGIATVDLWRAFRKSRIPCLAAAGLAAVAAMLAAGLFEYNFGDSEFLMLFLVLVTLPFAADAAGSAVTRPAARSRRSPRSARARSSIVSDPRRSWWPAT